MMVLMMMELPHIYFAYLPAGVVVYSYDDDDQVVGHDLINN